MGTESLGTHAAQNVHPASQVFIKQTTKEHQLEDRPLAHTQPGPYIQIKPRWTCVGLSDARDCMYQSLRCHASMPAAQCSSSIILPAMTAVETPRVGPLQCEPEPDETSMTISYPPEQPALAWLSQTIHMISLVSSTQAARVPHQASNRIRLQYCMHHAT